MRKLRLARAQEILAAATLATCAATLVMACSSSEETGPSAVETADAGAADVFVNPGYELDGSYDGPDYTRIRLQNDRCFSDPLAVDEAGLVPCHVVLFFPSSVRCAELALPDAMKSDEDYLEAYSAANGVPLPEGTFCGLDQEAVDTCLGVDGSIDDSVDAASIDSGSDGSVRAWCYVSGHGCHADASCDQALCTADGYRADPKAYAWLVCP